MTTGNGTGSPAPPSFKFVVGGDDHESGSHEHTSLLSTHHQVVPTGTTAPITSGMNKVPKKASSRFLLTVETDAPPPMTRDDSHRRFLFEKSFKNVSWLFK